MEQDMPKDHTLASGATILLNDFQSKAERYGGSADDSAKDAMLEAKLRLESYINAMHGFAGKFIRIREAAKRGQRLLVENIARGILP